MNILLKIFILHLYLEFLFVLNILKFKSIKQKLNGIGTHTDKTLAMIILYTI